MGHFFRAMNLAGALERAGQSSIMLINADEPSQRMLRSDGFAHRVVELDDFQSDWEGRLIENQGIHVWVNDRLNTDARHAANVKRRGIPLATFDDRGDGAVAADLNIAALAFDDDEKLHGKEVLRGLDYIILDPGIKQYRRVRKDAGKLLVTLGGSDTYGVTVKVVRCLRKANRAATVIAGPGFRHHAELREALGPGIEIKQGVPSLIAEFMDYELAITGGGITPFEANASGLPCILIANELFEVPVAQKLASLGGAVFAGYHDKIEESILTAKLPLRAMSEAGIAHVGLEGTDRVVAALQSL